jgi:hypothetical protein
MKFQLTHVGSRAALALAAITLCASAAVVGSAGASSAGTATTTRARPAATNAPIADGPSRSECVIPDVNGTGLAAVQAAVTNFDVLTDSNVNCIGSYLNGAQNWSQWVDPWITQSQYGYPQWVAEDPQSRQLVLQVDLIPDSLEDVNDPLSWEQSCANGDFDSYATELGSSLVAAGLQNSVLRLGAEANGTWEADFIGTTTQEQRLWATCFANEVTGLRQATGENFLIDWNPNACTEQVPYANYYPGNAYVDIVGLDLYDVGCETPRTPLTFAQLSKEPYGLSSFEAFAKAHGKPMSFPEWGLASSPSGDDPKYIDGIAATVADGDFAFEEYFNVAAGSAIPLSTAVPLSVVAFQRSFRSS